MAHHIASARRGYRQIDRLTYGVGIGSGIVPGLMLVSFTASLASDHGTSDSGVETGGETCPD